MSRVVQVLEGQDSLLSAAWQPVVYAVGVGSASNSPVSTTSQELSCPVAIFAGTSPSKETPPLLQSSLQAEMKSGLCEAGGNQGQDLSWPTRTISKPQESIVVVQ